MYIPNKTILIGTKEYLPSGKVHAIKMDGSEGRPGVDCLCGTMLIINQYDVRYDNRHFMDKIKTNDDGIDFAEITCKSCLRILRDHLCDKDHQVYNLTNTGTTPLVKALRSFGNEDFGYMQKLIEFSKGHVERQQLDGSCKWHEHRPNMVGLPHRCTYKLADITVANCSWDRCRKIFDTLRNRETQGEYLSFINNGKPFAFSVPADALSKPDTIKYIEVAHGKFKEQLFFREDRPDDQKKAIVALRTLIDAMENSNKTVDDTDEGTTCDSCFAEDGTCKDCAPINDYKYFVSEADYTKEENGEPPCQQCISSHFNSDEYPCNECSKENNWKYFGEKKDYEECKRCSTCRYNDFSVGAKTRCDYYLDCSGNYSHWEPIPKEEEMMLKNGLKELPFGIQKKTVFTYKTSIGGTAEVPNFETALHNVRFHLISALFNDAQPTGLGAHSIEVQNILENMTDNPEKWLEQLTIILQPIKPEGEK